MSATNSIEFRCKVITPIHIGVDEQKDYLYGLDYVYDDVRKEYLFYHIAPLFKHLSSADRQALTTAISSDFDINDKNQRILFYVLPFREDKSVVYRIYSRTFRMFDTIQKNISDGYGKSYIPGSSIKGALRSILLKKFKNYINSPSTKPEFDVFGSINKNNLSQLYVSDLYFEKGYEDLKFYRTKIACAHKFRDTEVLQWKNASQRGYSDKFNAERFVTIYECFAPNASGVLKVNLPAIHILNNESGRKRLQQIHASDQYKDYDEPQKLLTLIRNHTDEYLRKEIEFFDKYDNEYSENICEKLSDLLCKNNQSNTALLRVGSGVGFHSITGDWQKVSEDHITAWNKRRNHIWNKSRRLAFMKSKGDYIFYPMGFIQLSI